MICSLSHRQIRSLTCPDSHGWSRCFSSAKSKRQRWRQRRGSGERGSSAQAVAHRETTHRGSANAEARRELGEQLLVSISLDDVSDAAVRKRAVVQWFSLGALAAGSEEKVLTRCRTAGRCVLMPKLSSVLKSVPNAQRPREEYQTRRSCTDDTAAIMVVPQKTQTWQLSQRSGPTLSSNST